MSDFVANKSREPGELLTLSGGQSTSEGLFGKTLAYMIVSTLNRQLLGLAVHVAFLYKM